MRIKADGNSDTCDTKYNKITQFENNTLLQKWLKIKIWWLLGATPNRSIENVCGTVSPMYNILNLNWK